MDTIQDPGGLADRLYSEGVIARNVKEKVEACLIPRDKTRALVSAVQQNVGADPGSFQTFIDVLKKDKSNAKLVSMLEGMVMVEGVVAVKGCRGCGHGYVMQRVWSHPERKHSDQPVFVFSLTDSTLNHKQILNKNG